ncbi:hypothetical protein ACQEU6_46275 [Spirillospora sp. CA-108201]
MPIANPFQSPDRRPDRDAGPAEGADAGQVPASFGKPERRPDERDRPRTRTRKDTENRPQKAATPPHGGGQGTARDGGPAEGPGAAEDVSAPPAETGAVVEADADAGGGPGGEVVPLFPKDQDAAEPGEGPGRGELVPAALAEAAQVWWAEASTTVSQALDGSVYRARPPALRDSAVRLQRAEWSGGMPLLRWAGWIYGYPALAVRAVLMCALWLLDHPTRLLILAGVIAAALYL